MEQRSRNIFYTDYFFANGSNIRECFSDGAECENGFIDFFMRCVMHDEISMRKDCRGFRVMLPSSLSVCNYTCQFTLLSLSELYVSSVSMSSSRLFLKSPMQAFILYEEHMTGTPYTPTASKNFLENHFAEQDLANAKLVSDSSSSFSILGWSFEFSFTTNISPVHNMSQIHFLIFDSFVSLPQIFLPVHQGRHWTVYCVNFIHEQIDILDSADWTVNQRKKYHGAIAGRIRKRLNDLFKELTDGKIKDFSGWGLPFLEVPRQQLPNDCAFFVMMFLENYDGEKRRLTMNINPVSLFMFDHYLSLLDQYLSLLQYFYL